MALHGVSISGSRSQVACRTGSLFSCVKMAGQPFLGLEAALLSSPIDFLNP